MRVVRIFWAVERDTLRNNSTVNMTAMTRPAKLIRATSPSIVTTQVKKRCAKVARLAKSKGWNFGVTG